MSQYLEECKRMGETVKELATFGDRYRKETNNAFCFQDYFMCRPIAELSESMEVIEEAQAALDKVWKELRQIREIKKAREYIARTPLY